MSQQRECLNCGKKFEAKWPQHTKYCEKKCRMAYYVRAAGRQEPSEVRGLPDTKNLLMKQYAYDWGMIIIRLSRAGMNSIDISRETGVSRYGVLNLKNRGTQPYHYMGECLLDLYRKYVGEELPRMRGM